MNKELFFIELKSRAIWYIPVIIVALLASLFFGTFSVLPILMLAYIRLHQLYFNTQKMNGYNNFYFYLPVSKFSVVVTKNLITMTCLLVIIVLSGLLSTKIEFNLLNMETQYDDYMNFYLFFISTACISILLLVQYYYYIDRLDVLSSRIKIFAFAFVLLLLGFSRIILNTGISIFLEEQNYLARYFLPLPFILYVIITCYHANKITKMDII
jgi:hypothetical protein